ncbi:kinase-regulated stress-responsive transcription factor skn7 [Orbilia ellipsospora]|uniref:Kinase-regulated stress-responsive transcription factor skn7 n=1 Tax=Orbilia ellipsospora TaxID=2528407 RepID=A0AAV9XFE1_9PEZI
MDAGESSKGGGALGAAAGGADFVKKLYRMLGDKGHSDVVRWSDSGNSFIVFDNNEFTKNVLPLHFKHSNFASFVRQLNKYDFHKVRASDEAVATGPNGDQAWEFVHPQFRVGNDGNMEGIRRKAPATRAKKESEEPSQNNQETQNQVSTLQARLDEMLRRVDGLVEQYHHVLQEVTRMHHHMQRTDAILDRILRDPRVPPELSHREDPAGPYMTDAPPHHQMARHHVPPPPPPHHLSPQLSMHQPMQPQHGPPPPVSAPVHPSAVTPVQQAERFMHHGHPPQPPSQHGHSGSYSDMNGNAGMPEGGVNLSGFGNTASQSGIQLDATDPQVSTTFRQEMIPRRPQGLRKKSTGFVAPQWREAPKILLVEDDPTCRKIGLKFLEATGCLAYYASDGYEAIKKFNDGNGPQYDLILMDIVMPNLDGVSTCSIIRTAKPDMKDPPVIAMTSNIRTSDITLYFNAGMIDVLPKPFTREGLLQMLQRYLSRLLVNNSDPNAPPPVPAPNTNGGTYPKQESKASGSPHNIKSEYDATTNSHADDDHDDDDDDHTAGQHGQDTPDSSVGIVPSSATLGPTPGSAGLPPNSHHNPHHGHHPHHHGHHHSHHGSSGGMDGNNDYTFSEMPNSAGAAPGGHSFGSTGTTAVENEMLNATAGIYAPGLGGIGASGVPGAGGVGASPRGSVRRPIEAGLHDDYGDPRMKRMRFNNAA